MATPGSHGGNSRLQMRFSAKQVSGPLVARDEKPLCLARLHFQQTTAQRVAFELA